MGRVISTAIQLIDSFTRPSQQVIRSMNQLANNTIKAGKQIEKAGKQIENAGKSLTKSLTLPIAALATTALKSSNDFTNAMAKVGTIADTTAVPLENLRKQVISLSNDIGVSVTDLSEAQYQAISAGIDTASSVDFVGTSVKAAKGGFTDTTTAVNGLTTVLNAYKLEASEATKISDQMLIAQNFGKTSFGEMATAMGKVIPIASSLNVSTDELFASVAVLTKNGIQTNEAMTGLKAAYSNILKPSTEAAKTAKKLGLNFSAAHLQSVGWAQFLEEIKEKTGGNAEKMAKLFGSTEALNSVLVLAGKGSEDFAEAMRLMGESTGATQEAYEKMITPAERMNISINKVKNSLIQFGEALTPAFNKVADVIGMVGDKLNGLSESQVNMIVKFASILAVVPVIILVFGKLVGTVGAFILKFGTITKTIANFKGVLGLLTSPAGIVIGVLIGIAAAAFLIIKNFDKVKAFLGNIGSWFTSTFEEAGAPIQKFKQTFESIVNNISEIGGKLKGICKKIGDNFKKEFAGKFQEGKEVIENTLKTIVSGAAKNIQKLSIHIDEGTKVFSSFLDYFENAFQGNWESAAENFRNSLKDIFPDDVANKFIEVFDNLLPGIEGSVQGIKDAIHGLVEDGKKIFNDFKEVLDGVGMFFDGIFSGNSKKALNGFKHICNGILDTIGDIFKSKIEFIKNIVIGTLSKILPPEIVDGIATAFDIVSEKWDMAIEGAKGVVLGLKKALEPIIDDIKGVFTGLGDFLSGVFAGDWDKALGGLKTIGENALNGLVDVIQAPFKTIEKTFSKLVDTFKNSTLVKEALSALENIVRKVFEGCGIDFDKFLKTVTNVKNRVSSILNNIKSIFKSVSNAIGAVVKFISTIIAWVFGKKVEEGSSAAGAALTAMKAVFSEVFNYIGKKVKQVMDIIVPIISAAFGIIKNVIVTAVNSIADILNGLFEIFDGITTFISGVFSGNWEKAWEGLKQIFKGIVDTFVAIIKTPVNGIISVINGAIEGINKIGFSLPEWLPAPFGGKEFSPNIPTIPQLFTGTDNWKGGLAEIHDRGGEIVDLPAGSRVYPHDMSIEMARREGAAAASKKEKQIIIEKIAEHIEVRKESDIDKIVEKLASKLMKILANS